MIFKTFSHRKNAKFQKIEVSTKLWKAQIVLPYYVAINELVEKKKESVWFVSQILN